MLSLASDHFAFGTEIPAQVHVVLAGMHTCTLPCSAITAFLFPEMISVAMTAEHSSKMSVFMSFSIHLSLGLHETKEHFSMQSVYK